MSKPNNSKTPWPTKAAMEQIYEKHLWGGDASHFYSGEGSHLPVLVNPYVEAVRSFLNSFENPITVCDLGCGDFNVGKELIPHTKKYIAVDIVEDLIRYNKENFKDEKLEFHCLDVAVDELPAADCVIIRQVLQHLSNAEVQQVVSKLVQYKYVILTEHVPEDEFIPNLDIISGQGIRLKKNSGIDLSAAPFHFQAKEVKQLLTVSLPNEKGMIVTSLYSHPF